jgi:glycerol-3-phosphate dehydrogenase (NAD(P)+)
MVELGGLAETPLLFLDMPVSRLRQTARRVGDVMSGRHSVVHLVRSMALAETAQPSEILAEETPTQRFGMLTGPMVPGDVREGRAASAVCSTVFPEIGELDEEVLQVGRFQVFRNRDLTGTELAASYTRLIAMVCGLADELNLGRSLRSTLFARGLAETAEFVMEAGGEERTTFGLAGAGNLHADTSGAGSLSFRIGREFVQFDGTASNYIETLGDPGGHLIDWAQWLSQQVSSHGEPELPILEALVTGLRGQQRSDEVLESLVSSG